MASIIPTDHLYLTAQEVKDSSSDTSLTSLDDKEINKLICQAEQSILSYLGYEPEKVADMQLATLYTVESIHKYNGEPQIKSETSGNRSRTYELGEKPVVKYGLPEEAIRILDQYKSSFYKPVI